MKPKGGVQILILEYCLNSKFFKPLPQNLYRGPWGEKFMLNILEINCFKNPKLQVVILLCIKV